MATDDRQVLVALLVLHFVDSDGGEPCEQVYAAERLGSDPHTGVVDRPPRDRVAAGRFLLGRGDRVVDDQVLESPGEGRVVAGPGDLCHGHPVGGAVDPRGEGHQRAGGKTDVDVTPGSPTATVVLPGAELPAAPTAASFAHLLADPHHQLRSGVLGLFVVFPIDDHHRLAQGKQGLE